MSGVRFRGLIALAFGVFGSSAAAAGAPHLDGGQLSLIWVAPFVGVLLSIALLPLLAPEFWHHHFGTMSVFRAAAFIIPFWLVLGFSLMLFKIVHVMILEYIPFIILLLSLFPVAGGIRLKGRLVGTPAVRPC